MTAALLQRLACWVTGHSWDSDRPKGPLGYCPDTCWRCHATRPCPEPKRNPHECRTTERTYQ